MNPAAPHHLDFGAPPTTTTASETIASVTVRVEDAYGNLETADNATSVDLAFGTNAGSPNSGTLSGGGAQTVFGGVATFAGLAIDNVGTGYTLAASDVTVAGPPHPLLPATSSTFNITPRAITVTAVTDSKVYDGDTSSDGVPTITLGTLAVGDTVTWTQTFDNKNVGTNKSFIPAGTVTDGNDGFNYAITFVNDTTGVITPADPDGHRRRPDQDLRRRSTRRSPSSTAPSREPTTRPILDVEPTCSTAAGQFSDVGPYAITCARWARHQLRLQLHRRHPPISQATLTVTADAQTKVYGQVNPPLTFVYGRLPGNRRRDRPRRRADLLDGGRPVQRRRALRDHLRRSGSTTTTPSATPATPCRQPGHPDRHR